MKYSVIQKNEQNKYTLTWVGCDGHNFLALKHGCAAVERTLFAEREEPLDVAVHRLELRRKEKG